MDDHVSILGIGVSAMNLDDAVATIERWICERSPQLRLHRGRPWRNGKPARRAACAEFMTRAGMVTPDGMATASLR